MDNMFQKFNIKINTNVSSYDDMVYKPDAITFNYYQICFYPDPKTGLISVRKLTFDQYFQVIDVKEKAHNQKKVKKFIMTIPKSKYCVYPTFNINMISYPQPDQIMSANSSLLN
jgi:hypothetical protein